MHDTTAFDASHIPCISTQHSVYKHSHTKTHTKTHTYLPGLHLSSKTVNNWRFHSNFEKKVISTPRLTAHSLKSLQVMLKQFSVVKRAQVFLRFKVWITFLCAGMRELGDSEKRWNFVFKKKFPFISNGESCLFCFGNNFGKNRNFNTKSHSTHPPIEPHVLMYILSGFSQNCGKSYAPKFGKREL